MRIDDFKVGDRVWCLVYGWGKITGYGYSEDYPITVKFDNFSITYTIDGKLSYSTKNRSLFFEEITIPESAYIRPKWRAKGNEKHYYVTSAGTICEDVDYELYLDNKRFEIGNYFKTEQEAMKSKFYKVFHSQV